jgi:hypothetical protein
MADAKKILEVIRKSGAIDRVRAGVLATLAPKMEALSAQAQAIAGGHLADEASVLRARRVGEAMRELQLRVFSCGDAGGGGTDARGRFERRWSRRWTRRLLGGRRRGRRWLRCLRTRRCSCESRGGGCAVAALYCALVYK